MKKQKRQFLLKEIITSKVIANQEELVDELMKGGESVNQATLSRDLREMGISRVNTHQGPRYGFSTEGEEKHVRTLLSYEVESILSNESMIIVRTLPGRAQGVAEMLDSQKIQDVLATLAGDNTIFIAPRSVKSIKKIESALRKFIMQE